MIRSATPIDRPSSPVRVLVVDDDRRVASHTAQWLCSLGWHASAVGHADEALPLLARESYAACSCGCATGGRTGGRSQLRPPDP